MLNHKVPKGQPSVEPPMVLMLGTADWNQAIATNQHYMAREIASQYSMIFSESLGLRRPEITRRDIGRMFQRVRRLSESGPQQRSVPSQLRVVKPLIIPVHVPWTRLVNRALLNVLYKAWLSHRGPRILWTYSPVTYGFDQLADITVYHCVDLLGEFPQISSSLVHQGETALARNADLAIASSGAVHEHLNSVGFRRVVHWPNVADVALIRSEGSGGEARVPGRAVFAGNFSEKKVDFALLRELVSSGVELHLAGPIAEGGGRAGGMMQGLIRDGAIYHGHLSLHDLAKLYWTSSVGLIPYELNSYTRGVNPLKTFEYLAAGLRVVSTPVPAVNPVLDHVYIAQSHTDFVRKVVESSRLPSREEVLERQRIADQNSWAIRGDQARKELETILAGFGR